MGEPGGAHKDEYDPHMLGHILDQLEATLRCFGAAREHVTVVGGLAPPLLIPRPAGDRHIGTADIDLCLTVALADGGTGYYDEIAEALRRHGFEQHADPRKRFRWRRGDTAVDFLYPADDAEPPLRTIRGEDDWESAALRSLGQGFVALAVPFRSLIEATRERVVFRAVVDQGEVPDAWAYVVGPAALGAMKGHALSAEGRWKRKDAYDIVWVLDERGPEEAARQAAALVSAVPAARTELVQGIDLLDHVFAPGRVGPVWYAQFVADGTVDLEQAERFAFETVRAFTSTAREALG